MRSLFFFLMLVFAGSKIQAQKGFNAVAVKENRSSFESQSLSLVMYNTISKVNISSLKTLNPQQKKEDAINTTRLLIAERRQDKTIQKNLQ